METIMTQTIQFPRKIINQLLHSAQLNPEQEICGLVSAKEGIAHRCYSIDNQAEQSAIRFQMNPQQQIDSLRQIRENNEQLFAIYHSHPTAPAVPSTIDSEQLSYPEIIQLIISLNTKGILEIRGFKSIDGELKPINLVLSDD